MAQDGGRSPEWGLRASAPLRAGRHCRKAPLTSAPDGPAAPGGGGGASCRPGAGDREEGPFASPGAVYICTEDVFPDLRLQQLIAQQRRLRTDVPGDVVDRMKFGDQIFIEHVADVVSVSLAPRSEGRSVRWESRTREPPHGAVSREAPATGHTCKSTWSGTRNSGQTGLT